MKVPSILGFYNDYFLPIIFIFDLSLALAFFVTLQRNFKISSMILISDLSRDRFFFKDERLLIYFRNIVH